MRPAATRLVRTRLCAAVACVSLPLFSSIVYAANRLTPDAVTVKAFARPEGSQVELIVRAPLVAIQAIPFPTRGDAGYLDVPAVKSMLPGAARYWIADCFAVFDDGAPLAAPEIRRTRLSISADSSFDTYDRARAHFDAPDLAATENVFADQVWLDIELRYQRRDARGNLAIDARVAQLGNRVSTDLTSVRADGSARTVSFEGDSGTVYLEPRAIDAAKQFLARGIRFVIRRADLLLFLFCLALPFRRLRPLTPALIAFSAALASTLLAAAAGLTANPLWFHPLIDTFAALAVLLAACANIAARVSPRRRALLALAAGLVFGFSCSFHLADTLQFGGAHPIVSASSFGVAVVAAVTSLAAFLVPVLALVLSLARVEYIERIIVSALAADTAWGWFSGRLALLSRIPLDVVASDGVAVLVLRALAALVLLCGALWFVNEWLKSRGLVDEEIGATPHEATVV